MRAGWKTITLNDACIQMNGIWKGTKEPLVPAKVLRTTNFSKDCRIKLDDLAIIDVEKKKLDARRLQRGDIIVEKSGGGPKQPVGRVILFDMDDDDYSFCNFTSALRIKDKEQLDFNYLHKYLTYLYFEGETEKYQSNLVGFRNLDFKGYVGIEVPYPSLPEQQRIVAILDREFAKIDALKANAEKSLQVAKDLFKSALEAKVFAKGGSNRLLSSVCLSITDGDHMPPPKSTNGVPFITISNIDKNKYEIDFTDTFFVPETYFLNLKEDRKPKKGDVLYTVTGSFGIPVVISVDRDFCFQRHIALIRPNQSIVLPEFIFYWAMTRRVLHIADEVATGTAQRTVSLKSLRNFPIPVVSLDEQETIVDECKKLFSKGKVIQQNYQKTLTLCDDLKQSLLRKAFNGEL